MKKLLLAATLAVLTWFGVGASSKVIASTDCDTTIGTACDTQRVQANRPDHVGPKAATTVPMVCLSVIATAPTELVLAAGRVPAGAEVTGRVITSWRPQPQSWRQLGDGTFRREICIPASQLQSVMTLCNDSNRSVWSEADTAMLRSMKRIPASNPACLLGAEACAARGL